MTFECKPLQAGVPLPGSPELRALVAAVAAGAEARDRGETSPRQAIDLLRQPRIGTFRLPQPVGAAASLPQLFEFVIDLAEADSNIAHILRNHFFNTDRLLRSQYSPKYRRWLELVERGDLLGTGASELGVHGIGGPSFNTTLTPEGDGFVLNGEKYYSTGNLYTDHILVSAVTLDGQFATALAPVRNPGVVIVEDWDGIGQRQTASGTTARRMLSSLRARTGVRPSRRPSRSFT